MGEDYPSVTFHSRGTREPQEDWIDCFGTMCVALFALGLLHLSSKYQCHTSLTEETVEDHLRCLCEVHVNTNVSFSHGIGSQVEPSS